MNEDQIVDIWNLFKNYLDKKQIEVVAEKFVDMLADYGVDDITLKDCLGTDKNLDGAIQYYLEDDGDIDYDDELDVVVIRTKRKTNYEKKLTKKIRTSGCAVGTVYGDMMETFYDVKLNDDNFIKTSWMINISKKITEIPSLYIKAGAIHGCALCYKENILAYVEDVGRHNAVDKIAGWMFLNDINGRDKIFYTTGRLTSEMVIKTVQMEIPILLSRSGFTESGVSLANEAKLSLIGRMKGKRFILLSGNHRVIYD